MILFWQWFLGWRESFAFDTWLSPYLFSSSLVRSRSYCFVTGIWPDWKWYRKRFGVIIQKVRPNIFAIIDRIISSTWCDTFRNDFDSYFVLASFCDGMILPVTATFPICMCLRCGDYGFSVGIRFISTTRYCRSIVKRLIVITASGGDRALSMLPCTDSIVIPM